MRSRAEREPLLAQLAPILSRHDFPRTRMTSADHVRQAAQRHEIGVHSFAHDSMAFETASFFLQDLQRCQNLFRDDLRLPLSIYAFPNGSYRSEQVEILRQNGIEHVLLVDERISVRRASVHPRLTVGGSSATETRFRALGYGAGARA
jgi:peptidoglycan/xylan/chitin deacetylase (PgdA/CDA1 family)